MFRKTTLAAALEAQMEAEYAALDATPEALQNADFEMQAAVEEFKELDEKMSSLVETAQSLDEVSQQLQNAAKKDGLTKIETQVIATALEGLFARIDYRDMALESAIAVTGPAGAANASIRSKEAASGLWETLKRGLLKLAEVFRKVLHSVVAAITNVFSVRMKVISLAKSVDMSKVDTSKFPDFHLDQNIKARLLPLKRKVEDHVTGAEVAQAVHTRELKAADNLRSLEEMNSVLQYALDNADKISTQRGVGPRLAQLFTEILHSGEITKKFKGKTFTPDLNLTAGESISVNLGIGTTEISMRKTDFSAGSDFSTLYNDVMNASIGFVDRLATDTEFSVDDIYFEPALPKDIQLMMQSITSPARFGQIGRKLDQSLNIAAVTLDEQFKQRGTAKEEDLAEGDRWSNQDTIALRCMILMYRMLLGFSTGLMKYEGSLATAAAQYSQASVEFLNKFATTQPEAAQ